MDIVKAVKKAGSVLAIATGLGLAGITAAQAECLAAYVPTAGFQQVQTQWNNLVQNGHNQQRSTNIAQFNEIVRAAGGSVVLKRTFGAADFRTCKLQTHIAYNGYPEDFPNSIPAVLQRTPSLNEQNSMAISGWFCAYTPGRTPCTALVATSVFNHGNDTAKWTSIDNPALNSTERVPVLTKGPNSTYHVTCGQPTTPACR